MTPRPTRSTDGADRHAPEIAFLSSSMTERRRRLSLTALSGGLLRLPGAAKHVRDRVIPLVTRVFVYRNVYLGHGRRGGPGLCKHPGVGHGELVVDRIGIEAREAFDHFQLLAPAKDGARRPQFAAWRHVRGLDHQRVALPATTRVAEPLAD